MRGFCVASVLAVCVLVGGCGGEQENATKATAPAPQRPLQEITVTLDGWEGPAAVGLVMASELGYFEAKGIAVQALVSSPGLPLKYVAQGGADLALSHQPQVILAKAKGAPLVDVGAVIPHATAALIWKKDSGIRSIADLRGKTIAIQGLPFQRLFLAQVLKKAGLTVEDVGVKRVDYGALPALASGRADAIFGGSYNLEGAALEARGEKPVVIPVRRLGIPDYEEFVLVARADFAAENAHVLRDFMSALARGTAAAVADPKAAAAAIEQANEADPDLGRGSVIAEIRSTLPLLAGNAYMSPQRAFRLVEWMRAEGMIRRKVPPSRILTNAYR
jgi:putative hydroxymethylpyrimidine transport system substrate-binding protein